MRKLIIASTSTLHGTAYLEYLNDTLKSHFQGVTKLVFIPFARPGGISHDAYTEKVTIAFAKLDIEVVGLHTFDDAAAALTHAQAIFTGGGNTFVLVKELHERNLFPVLLDAINSGTPYLGCSAGSNICGQSMQTTNDMPIVMPPSFQTLGVLPFNLNPHFLDADAQSKHMGETRETRIKEYHAFNTTPVLGLREGSWLEVSGEKIVLKGALTARWFTPQQSATELEPETDFSTI
ncbi:dipeptidase PepE [Flavobacterium sp.]|uniref:dipeptidase PepE n=1 Tax=Flavobacterium sp. TaxID=239 RepID=UPI003B997941